MRRILAITAVLLASAGSAVAQPAGPPPCSSAAHRAFDFWVGTWNVSPTADPSQKAGVNRIEKTHNGCVLIETWTGASGLTGSSLNGFSGGKWHQTWMDSGGGLLVLSGGLADGSMAMQTAEPATWGGPEPAIERITWTPAADGTIRQHGERSKDGGKTWETSFDLTYRKAE